MTSQGRGEGVYKVGEKDKVTKDVRYGSVCVQCNAGRQEEEKGDVEETGDGRRENEEEKRNGRQRYTSGRACAGSGQSRNQSPRP